MTRSLGGRLRCPVMVAASMIAAAAWLSAGEAEQKPATAGTVILRLDGGCSVRPRQSLFGVGAMSLHEATMALRTVLRAAEPRVVLDCSHDFHPSLAVAEELASVIRDAKGHKKVAILLNDTDDKAMVVAAACDEVVMSEAGLLSVSGLALSSYYFADALDKLGIHFHAVISGDHKTAPEALTRSGPSPAGEQEMHELVEGLDKVMIDLSVRGPLTAELIKAARAQAPQTSSIAVATKLVDAAVEPDGWLASQPAPVRTYKDAKHSLPDLSSLPGLLEFWSQLMQGSNEEKHPRVVAVLELAGEIIDGEDSDPGVNIAPGDTCRLIDQLRDDARVVAVVLRVDSPGGSAGASDRIHHALVRLGEKKPVVALFDALAASGGYYLGCAAKQVLVHHGTITGSIGVFAVAPDASATLAQLGIHRFLASTGPRADIFGLGPWTPEKEAALQAVVSDTDKRFQGLVALNRHLDPAKVKELAGGRVYTGDQAVQLGLADGFGTLVSAAVKARALANEDKALPLERYPRQAGLLAHFGIANSLLGPVPASLSLWIQVASARLPAVLAWCNLAP